MNISELECYEYAGTTPTHHCVSVYVIIVFRVGTYSK